MDNVKVNDSVQLVPKHDWAGSLLIVTKVADWGIQGYLQMPNSEGQAYIRVAHNEYEQTGGTAPFVLAD